ncbi:MAG TPA: hypothetical protein VNQ81_07625 [Povalibacter sp.]|nr:hypothetical protein [Povalibacter sp.]
MSIAFATTEVFQPASSVNLASPEATQALERAWQRRRQELAGWQPSNGWLLDSRSTKRPTRFRTGI